jgi:uncharacterized membrane protein YdjX (TVP38/TMEM64 family)
VSELPGRGAPPRVGTWDWIGAAAFPLALAGLFAVAQQLGLREWAADRNRLEVRLEDWGIWAPVFFVACYSFLPLMFIPRAVLALVGGWLFGWPSIAYTWAGALIGETFAYGLARGLGRSLVETAAMRSARAVQVTAWLKAEGFWAVLILRLFPFVPTDVINFGSGFAGVRYRDYIMGTMLGILPGCAVFSYYGQLFEGRPMEMVYAVPLFLVPMLIAAIVVRRRYGPGRGRKYSGAEASPS